MHNDKKDRDPIYQHHSLYQFGVGNTENFSNSIHNSGLDYQLGVLERSEMNKKEKLKDSNLNQKTLYHQSELMQDSFNRLTSIVTLRQRPPLDKTKSLPIIEISRQSSKPVNPDQDNLQNSESSLPPFEMITLPDDVQSILADSISSVEYRDCYKRPTVLDKHIESLGLVIESRKTSRDNEEILESDTELKQEWKKEYFEKHVDKMIKTLHKLRSCVE